MTWMGADGMHALIPGEAPSAEEQAAMTKEYQKQIRNSSLWTEMVNAYGAEEAEQ